MSEQKLQKATPATPKPSREAATQNLLSRMRVNPADYSKLAFTPAERQKLALYMTHLSTGATAAIPLICTGAACPFASSCEFQKMGKAPLGQACIIETQLLQLWREGYIVEYDIDPDSITEIGLVNELAEIELMLYRINRNLAKPEHAELIQDETVGIDRQGNVFTRRAISAFMDVKERLSNRKARIIKLMVGDRQEKYKKEAALHIRTEVDPSQGSAQLRRELQSLISRAKELAAIPETTEHVEKVESISATTPEDLIESIVRGSPEEPKPSGDK